MDYIKRNISDFETDAEQIAFLSGEANGRKLKYFHMGCVLISLTTIALNAFGIVEHSLFESMLPIALAASAIAVGVFTAMGLVLTILLAMKVTS